MQAEKGWEPMMYTKFIFCFINVQILQPFRCYVPWKIVNWMQRSSPGFAQSLNVDILAEFSFGQGTYRASQRLWLLSQCATQHLNFFDTFSFSFEINFLNENVTHYIALFLVYHKQLEFGLESARVSYMRKWSLKQIHVRAEGYFLLM